MAAYNQEAFARGIEACEHNCRSVIGYTNAVTQANNEFLLGSFNGGVNRAVINDCNAIVSQTNVTLMSLKSEITISAHINGIETRMNRLGSVNVTFQGVVNEYHNALRKYQLDVENTFGRDIAVRVPTASEPDINAALAIAVGHVRSANNYHPIVVEEIGDAYTNSVAKEIIPKYPDLIFLLDSIDGLMQSIAFYNANVQFTVGGNRGVVQNQRYSAKRIALSIVAVIITIIVISAAVSSYRRRTSTSSAKTSTSSGY